MDEKRFERAFVRRVTLPQVGKWGGHTVMHGGLLGARSPRGLLRKHIHFAAAEEMGWNTAVVSFRDTDSHRSPDISCIAPTLWT